MGVLYSNIYSKDLTYWYVVKTLYERTVLAKADTCM